MPKTPNNFDNKMEATADGKNKIDIRFHKKLSEVERKQEKLKCRQRMGMKFTDTRNEV